MRASPIKRRVCVVLSLGPLFNLYAFACHVLFCVLRVTNIEFVQCFSLGSLWHLYAYVCHYVMRTSPHKHRVSAVLARRFPFEFCTRVFLCFACFASQTPGLCSTFPSAPFWVCTLVFVTFCLTNIGFVQCFSLGSLLKSLYAYVSHVLWCVFSLANIGFVQCLSLGPLLSLYAYLCLVMLCVLRLKNISIVQCFSLGSLKSLHAYIGHVLSKRSNLFLHFLSTSKRFSRLSVPDAFYKSRKAKSQRAIGLHSCESIFIIFAP